jgi:hypothetical protein
MSRDQSPLLAEKHQTVFRSRRCNGASTNTVASFYSKVVNLEDITPTDSNVPDDLTGIAGAKHTVRDTAIALFNVGSSTPTNQSVLDTLARKLAQDWFDYTTADVPGDVIYAGITTPEPCALIDSIEWTYRAGDVSTHLQSPPYNESVEEFQHWTDVTTGCTDTYPTLVTTKTPCIEVTSDWKCVSGHLQVTRKRICLEGGRLTEYVIGVQNIT